MNPQTPADLLRGMLRQFEPALAALPEGQQPREAYLREAVLFADFAAQGLRSGPPEAVRSFLTVAVPAYLDDLEARKPKAGWRPAEKAVMGGTIHALEDFVPQGRVTLRALGERFDHRT